MRIDPAHIEKLERAISVNDNGEPEVRFDIAFMRSAFSRMTPWEIGILTQSLMKATTSKRRTAEQRALLAMFVHDSRIDEADHG